LFAAYGQYTDTPLLVPEQCGYGGRVFGRAYDPSELLGDSCVFAALELRVDMPPPKMPAPNMIVPEAQVYGYADYGWLYRLPVNTDNAHTAASTMNAASAGAGLRLRWQNYLNVDLSAAKAIEGPRDAWRFFFIVTVRR
jgi:hemolysin activation/secretion protein